MTEHPSDLLARYDRLPHGDPDRQRVDAHLETCGPCREEVEALREVDRGLLGPTGALPALDAVAERLGAAVRRMRRVSVTLVVLALAQVAGAFVALHLLAEEPLAAGLVAGVLLADAALLAAVALLSRQRAEDYDEVAGDWRRGRETWRAHLVGEARASRVGFVSSVVMVASGLLASGLGLARSVPLQTALGLLLLAVGALGLVIHPRRARRARREVEALDSLFPGEGE